jgi:Ca2+-binding EF-hand superfamily protein
MTQIAHIRGAFQLVDQDFSGTISLQELQSAFRQGGYQDLSASEVVDIYKAVKGPNESEITWTSFLFASLDDQLLNEKTLDNAFSFMD